MTRFKDDFYHKFLYKNIDMIHAVTQEVKKQLEKFIPKAVGPKIEMVYLGVEEPKVDDKQMQTLREEYGLESAFIVGMVGRIEEGKGQYILIEAMQMLKHLNVKALIVGAGMDEMYMAQLKERIKELGVEDKIVFSGFTQAVNEHIKLCDVTVLATPKETFGLVVIESMINKVPVIATANGGPLEIIEDGVDGVLFDRTSGDLAQKIEILFNKPQTKEKLAQSAYAKVKEKFFKNKQMKKMYEVICES